MELLRRQQSRRQERREQQRYDQERAVAQEQQQQQYILRERELAMRAEDESFKRKLEVAKLMGTSAGQLGEPKPTGYEMPSTQEYSDAWYDAGRAIPKKSPHGDTDWMAIELERSKRARETGEGALTRTLVGAASKQSGYGAPEDELQAEAAARARIPGGAISQRQTPDFAPRGLGGGGGITPEDRMNMNFRREQVVKRTQEVQAYSDKVMSAPDNGTGDVALLVGYIHMIEPNSVVREGEFDRQVRTGGVPAWAMKYAQAITGEGLLPPWMRQEIKADAARLLKEQYKLFGQMKAENETEARARGLDPARVTWGTGLNVPQESEADSIFDQLDREP